MLPVQIPEAPQEDVEHFRFLTSLHNLRLKNDLKNAQLQLETAHVILDNHIKAAKNDINYHITGVKLSLKQSKGFLKPNGMNIGACIGGATSLMGQLPVNELYNCMTAEVSDLNMSLTHMKLLITQSEQSLLYCQVYALPLESCVPEQIDRIDAEIQQVKDSIAAKMQTLKMSTCIGEAEKKIFEQLGNILANEFSSCVQTELVEA